MDAILYAGDALAPTNIAQNLVATKTAGWTSVVLSYMHVRKSELDFNSSNFIQNGTVAPAFDEWQKSLNALKDGGTIKKIYLSIGGPGVHDWKTIQSMCIPFKGYGGTELEKNLKAIREKLPAIDGIEIDIEEEEAMNNYVYFSFFCQMANNLGFEISFSPYGVSGSKPFQYYTACLQQIRQASWGAQVITRFDLKNYSAAGCAPAGAWLDQIYALIEGFDSTGFITIGCNARFTDDGGKTWNGSCPDVVQSIISQNAQQNPFSISGGSMWNFDYIAQTTKTPDGCDGTATMPDYVRAIETGLGPAPGIKRIKTIDDLRNWNAQLEGANVARVPLKSRVELSIDEKACLVGFDMGEFQYDPFFDAWSQGCCAEMSTRTAANVYNFSYWQYVDIIYYIGHNFVTIPPVVWTNCAHKNGVLSLGTVNFDALSLDEAKCVLSPKPSNPVPGRLYKEEAIELLTKIAGAFGFDGYLLNCESYGKDLRDIPECVAGMLEILAAFNTQKLKSIWYDSPMSSANGHYDDKLTAEAYKYFKAASYFQTNYDWVSFDRLNYPQESFKVLKDEDAANALANRKRMFQGLYCATKGDAKSPPYKGRFFSSYAYINSPGPSPKPGYPTPAGCYTGLNVYYPDWLMYDLRESPKGKNTDKLPDRKEFHNNDQAFWNGSKDFINYPQKGPNPVGETQYMGHYLSKRTVINDLPFVTWFNDGEGDFYNIEGVLRSQGPWNNLSDQSVLPTYRFNIDNVNVKDNGTRIDHGTSETVFTGGCSLYLDFGDRSNIDFNLFDCNLVLNSMQLFSLVVKTAQKAGQNVMLYTESPTPIVASLQSSQDLGNGWIRHNYSVPSAPSNTRILRIGLIVRRAHRSDPGYYIGEFSMIDQSALPPPVRSKTFSDPKIDVLDFSDIYRSTSHYRIYGLTGSVRNLIGVVYNSAYRVAYDGIQSKNIFNTGLSGFTSYLVQEVNAAGNSATLAAEESD